MKCYVCGNEENNNVYEAREMMLGLRDQFTYFQCAKCKCLQILSIPADLPKYYPDNYVGHAKLNPAKYEGFGGAVKKLRYKSTLFHKGVFQKIIAALFPARQYRILATMPLQWNSRVLDVGCGMGNFLYPLYVMGMQGVSGVDPFISAPVTYANGYEVVKKYLPEVDGAYDVLLFNHSFEHVPDPVETLLAVKRLLADDGSCIIRIPTVSSYAWEHYGVNWYQLDAPRHFFLHSVESIKILAAKTGLELVNVIYDSTYVQFSGSEKYVRNIAKNEKAPISLAKRKLQKWKFAARSIALNKENRGDQAAFILKKSSVSSGSGNI